MNVNSINHPKGILWNPPVNHQDPFWKVGPIQFHEIVGKIKEEIMAPPDGTRTLPVRDDPSVKPNKVIPRQPVFNPNPVVNLVSSPTELKESDAVVRHRAQLLDHLTKPRFESAAESTNLQFIRKLTFNTT